MTLSRRTIRCGAIGGYLSLVASLGAVRYYPLAEVNGPTAADLIGAADGVFNGGIQQGQTPGPLRRDAGGCVSTDGGSGRVELPDIAFSGDFSLTFWHRLDATTQARAIFAADNYPANPRNTLDVKAYFFDSGTLLECTSANGTGGSNSQVESWPIGTWSLVSLVRAATTVSLYRDASLITTVTVGSDGFVLTNTRLAAHYYFSTNNELSAGAYQALAYFPTALTAGQREALRLAGLDGF